jgi:SHS2 domain-containing protein
VFEILEHTADIGFRATADTLPKLFESAAKALVAIIMETGNIECREIYALNAEGSSRESLLVNWLSEVLYHLDGRRVAISRFEVQNLDSERVSGLAFGEPRDANRQEGKLIVKGITYHQLRIEQNQEGWFCEVYVDV